MMDNYEIRASRVDDVVEIINVKADGFREEVLLYGHGPSIDASVEEESEFIQNKDGNNFSYVALDDGKIIGGLGGINKGNGCYYLGCIYVAMSYQNKGVGKMLMEYLDTIFKDARIWTLETPYKSYRNHHFYEKLGYVKIGETEPREDGFYLYCYEKKLPN